jgi:hypothetical protein
MAFQKCIDAHANIMISARLIDNSPGEIPQGTTQVSIVQKR